MKKQIIIPEINATAEFDEDLFNPVKKIGAGSYRSTIDNIYNAEVEIGKWSSIGLGLVVHGTTEHPKMVSTYPFGDKMEVDYPKAYSKGKIVIGNDVWIGSYATILSGVTIGDGAIIGANTVVRRNIPPYAIVIGNRAQLLKYRFPEDQIRALQRIKWWNWDEKIIKERIEDFKNILTFIRKYDIPANL